MGLSFSLPDCHVEAVPKWLERLPVMFQHKLQVIDSNANPSNFSCHLSVLGANEVSSPCLVAVPQEPIADVAATQMMLSLLNWALASSKRQ